MLLELGTKGRPETLPLLLWGGQDRGEGVGWVTPAHPRQGLPSNRDPGIQIVEFGGAQSNLLVLLPICSLNLQLHQLLLDPLHCFLLALHSPGVAKNKALNS